MQVHPQGVPWCNSSPDIVLNVKEFDSTCTMLEQQTLIGYFGDTLILKACCTNGFPRFGHLRVLTLKAFKSLPKVFLLFFFRTPGQVEHMFVRDPWTVRPPLLVFQHWSHDFGVYDGSKLKVPIWVEFPGLPIPCWSVLSAIVQTISKVVCLEPDKFFNARPQRRVCVKVELSRDLKDSTDI